MQLSPTWNRAPITFSSPPSSHSHPPQALISFDAPLMTFDLKALLPELDRRFHTFLVAGLCLPDSPAPITTGQIFNNLLYTMAKTITDILAPSNSDIPLPDLHSVFFTQDFWHAHLVYASDLASPEGLQVSAIDTLAGDQLFFLLVAAWVRSRAERPSVSYTKVTAKSQGLAKSCKYTTKTFKQTSGSNKFLIAGDGKMKRMREP